MDSRFATCWTFPASPVSAKAQEVSIPGAWHLLQRPHTAPLEADFDSQGAPERQASLTDQRRRHARQLEEPSSPASSSEGSPAGWSAGHAPYQSGSTGSPRAYAAAGAPQLAQQPQRPAQLLHTVQFFPDLHNDDADLRHEVAVRRKGQAEAQALLADQRTEAQGLRLELALSERLRIALECAAQGRAAEVRVAISGVERELRRLQRVRAHQEAGLRAARQHACEAWTAKQAAEVERAALAEHAAGQRRELLARAEAQAAAMRAQAAAEQQELQQQFAAAQAAAEERIATAKRLHEQRLADVEASLKRQLSESRLLYQDAKLEVEACRHELASAQEELQRAAAARTTLLATHQAELTELRSAHTADLARLEAAAALECAELEERTQERLASLANTHAAEMLALEEGMSRERRALEEAALVERERAAEALGVEQVARAAAEAQAAQQAQQLEAERQQHRGELIRQQAEAAERIGALEAGLAAALAKGAQEAARLQEEAAAACAALRETHAAEIAPLRQQLERMQRDVLRTALAQWQAAASRGLCLSPQARLQLQLEALQAWRGVRRAAAAWHRRQRQLLSSCFTAWAALERHDDDASTSHPAEHSPDAAERDAQQPSEPAASPGGLRRLISLRSPSPTRNGPPSRGASLGASGAGSPLASLDRLPSYAPTEFDAQMHGSDAGHRPNAALQPAGGVDPDVGAGAGSTGNADDRAGGLLRRLPSYAPTVTGGGAADSPAVPTSRLSSRSSLSPTQRLLQRLPSYAPSDLGAWDGEDEQGAAGAGSGPGPQRLLSRLPSYAPSEAAGMCAGGRLARLPSYAPSEASAAEDERGDGRALSPTQRLLQRLPSSMARASSLGDQPRALSPTRSILRNSLLGGNAGLPPPQPRGHISFCAAPEPQSQAQAQRAAGGEDAQGAPVGSLEAVWGGIQHALPSYAPSAAPSRSASVSPERDAGGQAGTARQAAGASMPAMSSLPSYAPSEEGGGATGGSGGRPCSARSVARGGGGGGGGLLDRSASVASSRHSVGSSSPIKLRQGSVAAMQRLPSYAPSEAQESCIDAGACSAPARGDSKAAAQRARSKTAPRPHRRAPSDSASPCPPPAKGRLKHRAAAAHDSENHVGRRSTASASQTSSSRASAAGALGAHGGRPRGASSAARRPGQPSKRGAAAKMAQAYGVDEDRHAGTRRPPPASTTPARARRKPAAPRAAESALRGSQAAWAALCDGDESCQSWQPDDGGKHSTHHQGRPQGRSGARDCASQHGSSASASQATGGADLFPTGHDRTQRGSGGHHQEGDRELLTDLEAGQQGSHADGFFDAALQWVHRAGGQPRYGPPDEDAPDSEVPSEPQRRRTHSSTPSVASSLARLLEGEAHAFEGGGTSWLHSRPGSRAATALHGGPTRRRASSSARSSRRGSGASSRAGGSSASNSADIYPL